MNLALTRRPRHSRLAALIAASLGAAALSTAATAPAEVTGSASKLRKCKGDAAAAQKLRVKNISCSKAEKKVLQRSDHNKWKPKGCNVFTLETCRSRVSRFKCKHAKKPGQYGVIVNSTCKRKRAGKPRQVVRWRVVAAG